MEGQRGRSCLQCGQESLILSARLHMGSKYVIVFRHVKSKYVSSPLMGSGREESSFLNLEPSKMLMVLMEIKEHS